MYARSEVHRSVARVVALANSKIALQINSDATKSGQDDAVVSKVADIV